MIPKIPASGVRRTAVIAALLILAGVLNNLQSLGWGFVWDDWFHQFALRRQTEDMQLRPWNLYDFADTADRSPDHHAGLPWWTDPDFKVRFFRPVTSVSIWLDYTFHGDWAPGYHLTSLLLFAVFLALAFRLYRALGASPRASLWALAFLALEDGHHLPVGWIANRNTMLAALFVVACLLLLCRRRRGPPGVYLTAAVICFLLACGSKESGLAAFPLIVVYLAAYECRDAGDGWRTVVARLMRSRVLWLFAVLTAAYLLFYIADGHGARSLHFAAPWPNPVAYLGRLAIMLPVGLYSLFLGFSPDLLPARPEYVFPVLIASFVVLSPLFYILFRTVGFTSISVLAIGWALCSIVLVGGAEASDRLLMSASVGSALLIGLFLDRIGGVRLCLVTRKYACAATACLLITCGIIASVPMMALRNAMIADLAMADTRLMLNAEIDRTAAPPRRVFLLNSPSSLLPMMMPLAWRVGNDDDGTEISVLQLGRRPLRWTRDDERTMTLSSGGAPFLTTRMERLFRVKDVPPPLGRTARRSTFTATIVATEGSGVTSVRFEFEDDLDHASYTFLAWRDGRLRRIAPPAIGETINLPELQPPVPLAP